MEDAVARYVQQFDWVRLSQAVYIIRCSRPPETIYRDLVPLVGSQEQVIIMTVTAPFYGSFNSEVSRWITECFE